MGRKKHYMETPLDPPNLTFVIHPPTSMIRMIRHTTSIWNSIIMVNHYADYLVTVDRSGCGRLLI